MQRLFFISLIFTLLACDSEMARQQEIITGMEHAIVKNTSDKFVRPLIANYINYQKDFKEDLMSPIYLYRCAVLYYRVGNFKEAAAHLETILREYPDTEILEDTYLTLAMIDAGRANNLERAEILFKEYLEKFPNGKGKARAEYFFLPKEEKLQDYIDAILKEINSLPRGTNPSEGTLSKLMFNYAHFVKLNPDAPLSPSYCLQGARLAIRLDQTMIALQFLDKIYQDYPDFPQYPEAMLMLALEYDTNITIYLRKGKVITSPLSDRINEESLKTKDLVAEGGKIYKEILKRFPDHDVAPSAKSGLKNLGKKTDEVVEEFIRIQDSINTAQQIPG